MMKMMGLLFVFLGISGYGISLCGEYRRRLMALKNVEELIACLLGYISYERDTLLEALKNCEKRLGGRNQIFLQMVLEKLDMKEGDPLSKIWKQCCMVWEDELEEKDLKQLQELFEQSGYLEGKMQLHVLETYRVKLREKIEKQTQNMESKCRIYSATGIMGGLFFCVLFW